MQDPLRLECSGSDAKQQELTIPSADSLAVKPKPDETPSAAQSDRVIEVSVVQRTKAQDSLRSECSGLDAQQEARTASSGPDSQRTKMDNHSAAAHSGDSGPDGLRSAENIHSTDDMPTRQPTSNARAAAESSSEDDGWGSRRPLSNNNAPGAADPPPVASRLASRASSNHDSNVSSIKGPPDAGHVDDAAPRMSSVTLSTDSASGLAHASSVHSKDKPSQAASSGRGPPVADPKRASAPRTSSASHRGDGSSARPPDAVPAPESTLTSEPTGAYGPDSQRLEPGEHSTVNSDCCEADVKPFTKRRPRQRRRRVKPEKDATQQLDEPLCTGQSDPAKEYFAVQHPEVQNSLRPECSGPGSQQAKHTVSSGTESQCSGDSGSDSQRLEEDISGYIAQITSMGFSDNQARIWISKYR